MRLALLLGALLVLPVAWGATPLTISAGPSRLTPTLMTAPLNLSRGAAGTATITANNTSATDSMTAGIATASTLNSTKVTNNLGVDVQARLVYRSASGMPAQCVKCDLQLLNGTATTTQIAYDGGVAPAAGAAGAWVSLKAGQSLWILAIGQGTLINDVTATIRYELEFQTVPGTGLDARYLTMAMTYTV